MAGGSRGAAATREGTHPDGRRARTAAPRVALGPGREGVPLRDRRGHADAGGAVRRPHSAARLPLHVRPQLRSRLSDVLVDGRHRRRRPPAPARARRDDDVRLAGAAGEAAGVQAADGLEHALGLADGIVYQTYSTGARGVEFLMGYYPILDRAPKGRDEGDASQLWIRRHDEYDQNR